MIAQKGGKYIVSYLQTRNAGLSLKPAKSPKTIIIHFLFLNDVLVHYNAISA